MNDIENSKIGRLVPEWAPFHGMSLLFDNPGSSLSPWQNSSMQNVSKIDCSLDLEFYKVLHHCLDDLAGDLPANDYLFCRLPYSSYHITVNDLVNKANEEDLNPDGRDYFGQVFDNFPGSLQMVNIPKAEFLLKTDWKIRFMYSHLQIWGDSVLVVRLQAADQDSEQKLEQLKICRQQVNLGFQTEYGQAWTYRDKYEPHISLAYFGHQGYGRQFKPLLAHWDAHFSKAMKNNSSTGLVIEFSRVSLYGFTDMASFFKIMPKQKR